MSSLQNLDDDDEYNEFVASAQPEAEDHTTAEAMRDENLRRMALRPRVKQKFEFLMKTQQAKQNSEEPLSNLDSDSAPPATALAKPGLHELSDFVWSSYHPLGKKVDPTM